MTLYHFEVNPITSDVIAAAIEVHRVLGPGLLESVYLTCLLYELRQRGFKIETQEPQPIVYKGMKLDCGYRLDLVVNDSVIVEVKSVDRLAPIHQAQMITYLRLTGLHVGLLLNFNVPVMREGIKRVLNNATAVDPSDNQR